MFENNGGLWYSACIFDFCGRGLKNPETRTLPASTLRRQPVSPTWVTCICRWIPTYFLWKIFSLAVDPSIPWTQVWVVQRLKTDVTPIDDNVSCPVLHIISCHLLRCTCHSLYLANATRFIMCHVAFALLVFQRAQMGQKIQLTHAEWYRYDLWQGPTFFTAWTGP